MTKPLITTRDSKGWALDFDELDANFTNLRDATISLTADTGGTVVTADLNGNITLVAGSGVTLTGNNSTKTITIESSGSSSLNTDLIEVGEADTDTVIIQAENSQNKTLKLQGANAALGSQPSINLEPNLVTITSNTVDITSHTGFNEKGTLGIQGDGLRITGGDLTKTASVGLSTGSGVNAQQGDIELTPHTYGKIVCSNTSAFLLPTISQTDLNNILDLTAGMMVYNTTTSKIQYYNGSAWIDLS